MKLISFALVIYCFFCLLTSTPTLAQSQLLYSKNGNYEIAGLDVLGNSYVIKGNTLYKFDANGKMLGNYSQSTSGFMTHVNISNPLKITVLFADTRMLAVLDNTLSPVGNMVHLSRSDILDPVVACASGDNGFIVYDAANGMFSMISWTGNVIFRSSDVRRLSDKIFLPIDMQTSGKYVLALSDDAGVIVLDQTGAVHSIFPLEKGISSIGANGISVAADDYIILSDFETGNQMYLKFNTEGIQKYYVNLPYILVQHKKKISLYLLSTQ